MVQAVQDRAAARGDGESIPRPQAGGTGPGRVSPMATAVEFAFENKVERPIPAAQARAACDAGRFVWIDLDAHAEPAAAGQVLRDMGVNEHAIREALGPDVDGRHDLYDDCLHIAVTS